MAWEQSATRISPAFVLNPALRQSLGAAVIGLVLVGAGLHTLLTLQRRSDPLPPERAYSVWDRGGTPRESARDVGPRLPDGPIGALAGRMGWLGPLFGSLTTSTPLASESAWPSYNGTPLPLLLPGGVVLGDPYAEDEDTGASELPDDLRLELSRLANPEVETRPSVSPSPASVISPASPLSVQIGLGSAAVAAGTNLNVKVTCSAECFLLLVRVRAGGEAVPVFRSPAPVRSFSAVLKAGPAPGAEYLVAVGTAQAPTPGLISGILKGQGAVLLRPSGVSEEAQSPVSAWSSAVQFLTQGSAGGSGAERYEWSVAGASFACHPAPVTRTSRSERAPSPAGPLRATGGASELPSTAVPALEPKPPAAGPKPAAPPNKSPETDPGA